MRWLSTSPWTPDGRGLVTVEGLTVQIRDANGRLSVPSITIPEVHEFLKEPIFTADGGAVIFEAAEHWVRVDLRDPSRVSYVAMPPRDQRETGSGRDHGQGSTNLSRDGAYVYYLSPARDEVRIHRFDGHELVRRLAHDETVKRVEFSPRGDRIMTVSKDRRIRVWSIAGDEPPAVFEPSGTGFTYSLWSPDGEFVAVAVGTAVKDEYTFHVWRPGQAAEVRHTALAVVPLTRVSPDGRDIAFVGADDRVRLVSTAGEVTVRELDPVDSQVGRLAFSPDGAWLLSQATNAVFVWSTESGALVRILRSPGPQLSLGTFDPTGTRVLFAARDGTVTIAPFDPAQASADLSARLREATSYCYSYERRRIDLSEPPTLAWANYAACERSFLREPGSPPPGVTP